MSTRYLDAPRCKMIAEALAYTRKMRNGEFTRSDLEVLDQMQGLFAERAEPNTGMIVTLPGDEA